jgi:FkbM family methyltransferase
VADLRSILKRIPLLRRSVGALRRIRRDSRRSIRVGHARVAVPRDMRWTIASGEHYERNVTATLLHVVELLDRPVFYDVGANYGFYTMKLAPQARWVYAFEPVAETFRILSENVAHNGLRNVSAFKLGLFETESEVPINLYSSSGTNSIVLTLPPSHPAKLVGRELIRVVRLEDLVEREGLLSPDVIKLDVEGAELAALRGARRLIASSSPIILLESREEPWVDQAYSRASLLRELHGLGYVVAGLSENYDDPVLYPLEQFEQANVVNIIAVPRRGESVLKRLGLVIREL